MAPEEGRSRCTVPLHRDGIYQMLPARRLLELLWVEAIRDPEHERHEELLAWVGGHFDSEAIDLDAVNRRLRRFRWP